MPVFHGLRELARFRELLLVASAHSACAIHAYVLMTNHVHLLVTPAHATSLSQMMRGLTQSYASWFNRRHGRTGTLWEGRYRSAVVNAERYLLACSRYIELNPVRANMVRRPEQYHWSSYRANACGVEDPLLKPHPCYSALGDSAIDRRRAYGALFAATRDDLAPESRWDLTPT